MRWKMIAASRLASAYVSLAARPGRCCSSRALYISVGAFFALAGRKKHLPKVEHVKRLVRLLPLPFLALIGRRFPRRQSASLASVLYIKPDHLGDLLLAT